MSVTTNGEKRTHGLFVWNQARRLASELLDLFYNNTGQMSELQERWQGVTFPPTPEIVQNIMKVGNTDTRQWARTDELARWIQTWETFQ